MVRIPDNLIPCKFTAVLVLHKLLVDYTNTMLAIIPQEGRKVIAVVPLNVFSVPGLIQSGRGQERKGNTVIGAYSSQLHSIRDTSDSFVNVTYNLHQNTSLTNPWVIPKRGQRIPPNSQLNEREKKRPKLQHSPPYPATISLDTHSPEVPTLNKVILDPRRPQRSRLAVKIVYVLGLCSLVPQCDIYDAKTSLLLTFLNMFISNQNRLLR